MGFFLLNHNSEMLYAPCGSKVINTKAMLIKGVEHLTKLGFYSLIECPLEGAEVHDVMDHLLMPPEWGVKFIPPTVEGEELAMLNSVAKRFVGGWMAEGLNPLDAIKHLNYPDKENRLSEAIAYWVSNETMEYLARYYYENA